MSLFVGFYCVKPYKFIVTLEFDRLCVLIDPTMTRSSLDGRWQLMDLT